MTTPAALDPRAVAIERETERIVMTMTMGDVMAKEYCQHGVFIPTSVIRYADIIKIVHVS